METLLPLSLLLTTALADFLQGQHFASGRPPDFFPQTAFPSEQGLANINYPIKTVRRIVDNDGNVRVITRITKKGRRITAPKEEEASVRVPRENFRFPSNADEKFQEDKSKRVVFKQEQPAPGGTAAESVRATSVVRVPKAPKSRQGIDDGLLEDGPHLLPGPGPGVLPGPPILPGGGFGGEKGGHFDVNRQAAKGAQGHNAYNNKEHFDKGKDEKHGHSLNKGHSASETGDKKGHLDEKNHYTEGHRAANGQHGKKQAGSKGHRKGHKKKGYRTVHHKDEFKKDEVFYDDEHDVIQNDQYGRDETASKLSEGGNTKSGHVDSGFATGKKNHHAEKEEGHDYNRSKGYLSQGKGANFANQASQFVKDSGGKEGEQHVSGGFF